MRARATASRRPTTPGTRHGAFGGEAVRAAPGGCGAAEEALDKELAMAFRNESYAGFADQS
jgi:hypothetical protein